LQNPSQTNGGNLNSVRLETSRTYRKKKREYLKVLINELETNSKNKNIRDLYRGINEFKKSYQPRTNLVKHMNGDLLADSHSIFNRRKNYFCRICNVPGVKVELAMEKLKRYKSLGTDQIPGELRQA
jgi:hypothetical protein